MRRSPYLVALTVTLATFMEVLDTSIANVSLPHIAGSLSATVDESTWVLTSYLVANAVILPLSGWLSSVLGRKRFYMGCVALFAASSCLCGLAPSLFWLVVFRVIQGVGGGGLQPSEQAILHDIFPPEKLGMGMAVYGVAVVTAPIIGPTLGGWITDNFTWRWIFFINVPVGLLSLYLTSRMVEDPPDMHRRDLSQGWKLDGLGLGTLVLGIGSLQLMLDKGQREDWFASHFIQLLCLLAVVGLVVFVWRELTHDDPIVDLKLLGDRNFGVSIVLMFMLGAVLFGSTVLLPYFLQTLMGYTATKSGLVLSPGGFATMLCMPLVGAMLSRGVQARWLILWGLGVCALSLHLMSHFDLAISYRVAMLVRVVQASGLAFLFVPINTAAYAFVPKRKGNAASGLINLARNLGGSVGIAVATTLLARWAQFHQTVLVSHMTPYDAAYRAALARAAALAARAGLGEAGGKAARALLYGGVLRQANMLAFVDDFRLLSLLCLLTMPVVLFLRPPPPGPRRPAGLE